MITANQLRSSAWRPLFRDIFADCEIIVGHGVFCSTAQKFLLPDDAVMTGRSAAFIYGVALIAAEDPVEVLVPPPFGPVTGLKIFFGKASDHDIRRRADGLRLASPTRTCWDLALHLDPVEAVVFTDALVAKGLTTCAELVDYAWSHSGERGWRRMLRVARLTDPAAESPQESRLRVRLVLAGVPRPVAQHIIMRNGRFVARVDLAWPELKVAVEYDGRWHGDPAQLDKDRARLNRLVGADWLVLHLTAKRLNEDFAGFLAELTEALRSRARS